MEIHAFIEHHLSASQGSLNHPEKERSRSPSFEKETDAGRYKWLAQDHMAKSGF